MNNRQPRRANQRSHFAARRPSPADIWRTPRPLPDLEPIRVGHELGALLRSLGDPPMHDGATAGHYFESVTERAASVAMALALSAGLLADSND